MLYIMIMDLYLETKKQEYNKYVTHIIQSWQWGEFRQKSGTQLLRFIVQNGKKRAFQITFHKIPFTNQYVGYMPKGPVPDKELSEALQQIRQNEFISKRKQLCFIKIEPHIKEGATVDKAFIPSLKSLFTKYNFELDLTPNEETLLKNMHPKTRYNIGLAQKKGVVIEEKTTSEGFETFLELHFQTTKRQNFYSHNRDYHLSLWKELSKNDMARILVAYYKNIPLSAWLLINFKDTLYYPYGGSSLQHKEVMANNLMCWEAIKLGKRMGLKKFDMWGALGKNPNKNDSWYGFHKFKQGYGAKLIEYMGTYDLVFNYPLYWLFTLIDKLTFLKVVLLKLVRR